MSSAECGLSQCEVAENTKKGERGVCPSFQSFATGEKNLTS